MLQPASRSFKVLAGFLLLSAGLTCTEPTGPKSGLRAVIGLTPVFSKAATEVYNNLVSFQLAIDNIHVRLQRANGTVVLDTTVAINAGQDSIVLNLSVELDGPSEELDATIELRDGEIVLFSGTQKIIARTGGNSPPQPPIPVEYAGPGSTVTSLDVQPDTTISGLAAIQMRPVARDANNQVVTNLNLLWSLDAGTTITPTVGTVSQTGVFQPTGSRGTAIVTAELPNGRKGSATVTIAPPPAVLTLISGGGQTGVAGTALTPIVVEVQATDGGPVEGHNVTFAVTSGGGSVSVASATTGSNGRATVVLTLGTTAGANSIQITALGLAPISVSATATAGPAAKLVMVQQPSATAVTGVALATQPSVQLQDAFNNVVSSANVAVTAALTTPAGRTIQGTTTVNTNASGVAAFAGLAIAGAPGTTTLTFTSGSLTSVASNSISVSVGAPASLSATSSLSYTDSAGANGVGGQLPAVVVRDASSNPLQGVQVKFRRHGGAGATINALPDTMVLATTDANGAAALAGRRLQTVVGFDTVLVTGAGLNDTLRFVTTVTPASATNLTVAQQPSASAVTGVVLTTQPSIQARDAFGNAVTTANIAIVAQLTTADGRTLQGTTTRNTNTAGLAQFTDLGISGPPGPTTLTFTSGSLTSAISSSISVTSGAPFSLSQLNNLVSSDTAGANVDASVRPAAIVRDASSNPLAGVEVKFRRHGGAGATINAQPDTMVLVTTDDGGAAFLSARRLQTLVGFDTVLVTAAGLNDTLRFVATVTHASATNLAFVQQPPNGSVGVVLSPATTVAVRDQFGNRVTTGTSATATVTVGLGLVDALFSGTKTRAAVAGLATFDDLTLTPQGSYTMLAASSGLTGATSGSFTVSTVSAGVKTWIGTMDASWENPGNWSGGTLPGPQDSVLINVAGTQVTLSSAVTVAKVTVGGGSGSDLQSLAIVGLGALTVSDSLRINASGAVVMSVGGNTTVLSGGPVYVLGILEWFGGNVTGSGVISVLPGGTFAIGGADPKTLDGRTIQTQGTFYLFATAPGNLALSNGAAIQNFPGAEFLIQGDANILQGTGAQGFISNSGNMRRLFGDPGINAIGVPFTNAGNGLLEIPDGTLAFTGPSFVNTLNATVQGTGTLDLSGTSVVNGGTFAPGMSPGVLEIEGNFPMQSTSKLAIELGGTTLGTEYDLLAVSENAVLGGTLEISLYGGFTPQVGQTFTIMTFSSATGNFSSISGLNIGGGLVLNPVFTATSLTLEVQAAAPATVSWASPVNGNWNDPTKWSTGLVPGISDIVAIDVAGTYTVTLNANPTITGLYLGGSNGTQTLTGNGRVLTVNGATNVEPSGALNLVNSNLGGSGTLANLGQVILQNGTITATQTFTNQGVFVGRGSASIDGPLNTTQASTIRSEGSSAGSSSTLQIVGGFTNFGLIELTSIDGGFASALTMTAGTLINAAGATIRSSLGVGGLRMLTTELINQGTLEVNQPLALARAGADHINAGTIDLTNANLTVNQSGTTPSFTNANSVIMGASRTWTVTGGTLDLLSGSVTGPSTSTLNVVGLGTIAFTPPNVGVQLTLSSVTIAGNVLTIGDGQTLTLLNGALSDQVIVQEGGTLISHGTVSLDGPLTVQAGGVVRAQGNSTGNTSQLTVANGFSNGGLIELTSVDGGFTSTFAVTNGTLFNLAGGVIHSDAGVGGPRNLVAQLNNAGILDVDAPLLLQASNADHVNSGTIDASQNLTVNLIGATPSFTNTSSAAIFLSPGRTLSMSGGAVDLSAGTVSGATTSVLAVSSSTLAFTTASVTLPMTITNTTITNGPVIVANNETLTLLNGGLSDPVIVQAGGFLVSHGTVVLDSVNVTPSGTLRVEGDPTGNTSALTITKGFINSGFIDLTSVSGGFASVLNVTNGSLTNGSLIRSSVGAGGLRTLGAQLVNAGTGELDVEQALTLNKIEADHQNAGNIDVTAANLTVIQEGDTPLFANTGTVLLGVSRALSLVGGTVTFGAGTVSGPTTSTLFVTSATLSFTPTTVGVPMTLTNTAITGGVTIGSSQTVTLLNGGLNDQVTIQGEGTLLTHGAVSLNGTLTMQTGSTLRVQGDATGNQATLTVANGFNNNGTIELTSISGGFASQLNVTGGTLTNAENGTIRSDAGAGGIRTLTAQLNNQGTLSVEQPLTLDKANVGYVNSGVMNLVANLTVTQSAGGSFNNSGAINLQGAGRTMSVTSGLLNANAGLISGDPASTLIVTNAFLSFSPSNITVPLTLTGTALQSGSLVIGEGQTVTLLGGGLNDPVSIGGTLVTHGTVALSGLTVVAGGALKIEGDPTGNTANLVQEGGFTNNGSIELTSVSGGFASQLTVNNGTLTNAASGTVTSSAGAGGIRTLTAQLDNQGILDINQALTLNRLTGQHSNSGSLNVSADLTVIFTAGGTFTNTSTGGITLVGDNRTFSVTGGTLDVAQGTVTATTTTAKLSVNTSTLSFTPNSVSIPLQIVNSAISGGINVGTSQSVTLLNSNLPAANTITIGNGGTLVLRGGNTFNGTLTQNGNIQILGASFGGSSVLTMANGFTNNGLINLTSDDGGFGSQLTVTNGTLTNGPTGIIRSLPGAGGSRSLTAQFDNQQGATLDVSANLAMNAASADHVNAGAIDITGGSTLVLTQTGTSPSFTNAATGAVTMAAGSNWTVNAGGGLIDLDQGSVTGELNSRLLIFNAFLAFTTANIDDIPLTLAGTAIVGGSITIPNGELLNLWDAAISDDVIVQNGGTLLVHGNSSLSGALTLLSGSTLRLQGQSGSTTAALTVSNGFVNNGLIELTSINGGFASQLTVTSGALLNAVGATIHSDVGANGLRTLAAELNNEGTLDVDQPLTINKASASHLNGGTIDMTANVTIAQSGTNPAFTSNGTIAVPASRSFTVSGGTFTNGSLGVISGFGTVNVSGTTFSNDGVVSPGDATTAGTLTFTGNYTQTTNGRVSIKLGGLVAGTNYDVLALGNATFAGLLMVTPFNGFTLASGQSFNVVSYGTRSGTFVPLPPAAWQMAYNPTQLTLTVIP